jgi:hypothetical protein
MVFRVTLNSLLLLQKVLKVALGWDKDVFIDHFFIAEPQTIRFAY